MWYACSSVRVCSMHAEAIAGQTWKCCVHGRLLSMLQVPRETIFIAACCTCVIDEGHLLVSMEWLALTMLVFQSKHPAYRIE